MKRFTFRLLLLALFFSLIAIIYLLNLNDYLNINTFLIYKDYFLNIVHQHYSISVITFIALYIIAVALSIPSAASLSIFGGFLFGIFFGTLYNVIGATLGALISFLTVRYILGSWVQKRYEHQLKKFNQEIKTSGIYYLLSLRLMPIMPFFLVNFLAGLTHISIYSFLWVTTLGIIPGALVFSFAGQQLQSIKKAEDIFSPHLILALMLLAILALLPAIAKKIKQYSC